MAAPVASTAVMPVATRVAMMAASTVPRPAGVALAYLTAKLAGSAQVTPAIVVVSSPACSAGRWPVTAHTQPHSETISIRRLARE